MKHQEYIVIQRSWQKRNPDGSLLDFGLESIRHKQSYCSWNDDKKDWDYVNVFCNCKICKESKAADASNTNGQL